MKSDWREAVVAYIRREALPVDKYGHQPRLYALAAGIAAGLPETSDDDVLFASAWMHDLGVFVGHRPSDPKELAGWDHVPYTISRSAELLREWGFPGEKLEVVAEAIRTHQPKDEAVLLEAKILRDADILEQLGAIGALRALVKIGRDTRYATFSDVVPILEHSLKVLPDKLQLAPSKLMARERVSTLESLLGSLKGEAGGLLF